MVSPNALPTETLPVTSDGSAQIGGRRMNYTVSAAEFQVNRLAYLGEIVHSHGSGSNIRKVYTVAVCHRSSSSRGLTVFSSWP